MNTQQNMEERLWDYIDGICNPGEKSVIDQLLESNREWKKKYGELLEVHQLIHSTGLEEPSLRFTKNVMEEISKYQISPAAKTYINKKIIWGIAAFMITIIVAFLIYGIAQVDWSAGGESTTLIDFSKIDLAKFFSNTWMNFFMMVNVVLGLMLLDRYLNSKRKQLHKEA
jgi:hypothetical protein